MNAGALIWLSVTIVGIVLAVWAGQATRDHFSAKPAAPAAPALSLVDWQAAASCLLQRWDPYNESLAEMGRVVRFCATSYQGIER